MAASMECRELNQQQICAYQNLSTFNQEHTVSVMLPFQTQADENR